MTHADLSEDEKAKLGAICAKHSTNIQEAVLAAYEEGLITGAFRVTQRIATGKWPDLQQPAPATSTNDDDEDLTGTLTAYDRDVLTKLGINPTKTFRQRNSVFTIVGYKPSRWKFPISVQTQNGARYKMTVDQVKQMQRS